MLLIVLGVLVSGACVVASAVRLGTAAKVFPLDAPVLVAALRTNRERADEVWSAVRDEILASPGVADERDLVLALSAPAAERVALVNEQLWELDYRAQSWSRVPRVCASISTSTGFLLAFARVASLAASAGDIDFNDAVATAINAVAIGVAGTAFCVAIHVRAAAMVRRRLAAVDTLVALLDVASPDPSLRGAAFDGRPGGSADA